MSFWSEAGKERGLEGFGRYGFPLALAALAALSARSLSRGLAPDSLWLDDLWVVVLAEQGTLRQIFTFDAPVSPVFVLLLEAFHSLVPVGDAGWQLAPFLAMVAGIPLIGAAARRATGSSAAGIAAAALYGASPILLTFSVRVKSFSVDALVVTILLFLASNEEDDGWALYVAAALLAPLSFTSIFISVPLCMSRMWRRRRRTDVVGGLLTGCAIAVTYFTMIQGRANAALHEYWRDFYFLRDAGTSPERVIDLLTNPFAEGLGFLALPAIPGVWFLVKRRAEAGIAAVGMYGLLLLTSAAGRYPVGTGRTEIFTFPVMILLTVAGIHAIVNRRRSAWIAIATVLSMLLVWNTVVRGVDYVEAHDRQVIELANQSVQAEDALVVYPLSSWALAHYGRWPSRLAASEGVANGYVAIPLRERVLMLDPNPSGTEFTEDPAVLEEQMEPFLSAGHSRVWLVATSAEPQANQWIVDSFHRGGYHVMKSTRLKGAGLALFVRR